MPMLPKISLRRLARRLRRAVPLVGLLGWLYGLPGFVTDGRWWWQSTSGVAPVVGLLVVTSLVVASVTMAAKGMVPGRRMLSVARRFVAKLV